MEVTVTLRETIKPSSPTPHHLKHLKLSLIDQSLPTTLYGRLILVYSARGDVNRFRNTNMSRRFRKSLSEVLTDFYPLAGRFDELSQSIECNDDGLEYTEARVKAPLSLSEVLASPNPEDLDRLHPPDVQNYETGFKGLSAVQVTLFEQCGGVAIGFSVSHLLVDAMSLVFFINTWAAAVARGEDGDKDRKPVAVVFDSASLFPPRAMRMQKYEEMKDAIKFVIKRFVFTQSQIDKLKARFAYPHPTRVEVVSALLFRCMINAFMSTSSKPVVCGVVNNLRKRMRLPSPPVFHFGNIVLGRITAPVTPECLPKPLNDIGMEVRGLIKEIDSDFAEKLVADGSFLLEYLDQLTKLESRFAGVTSMCRMPIYEADFGWGAPTWAASVHPTWKDSVVIMDAYNGDGIEAWAILDKEDMALFESDTQLLEFASSNPRVSEFRIEQSSSLSRL